MANQEIVEQCSSCKKFKHSDNKWKESPPIPAIDGIHGNISHGLCNFCFDKQLENL